MDQFLGLPSDKDMLGGGSDKPGSLPDLSNFHVNPGNGANGSDLTGSSSNLRGPQQHHNCDGSQHGSPYSTVR